MPDTILNLYKPVGWTPLHALEHYRAVHPELVGVPMTYAGRLDPIAEGVLLVLVGEEAGNREPYLSLSKVYEAEILFGVETDSWDVLGSAGNAENVQVDESRVTETINSLVGSQMLRVPPFSSVPVNGRPLFSWALENRLGEISVPERSMGFNDIKILGFEKYDGKNLLAEILARVELVQGSFRQDQITRRWGQVLGTRSSAGFYSVKLEVSCQSGAYVRSLAKEAGNRLGIPSLLFKLKRTKVGGFDVASSIRLV